MIILDATTKSLQFNLGGSITTNQLPFAASYIDTTGTNTTPGEQDGISNNTTAVAVASAPAASTQRLVKSIVIQNADTASAKVTVIYNNNATLRNIIVATLAVGDQLVYEDGNGWLALDANGNIKNTANSTISLPLAGANGGTGINNGSSAITIGGNVTFSGAYNFIGTLSGNTSVTFPTSGTLATLGSNTFTGLQTFSPSSGIAGYISAGAIEEAVFSNGNSGTSKSINLDNGNLQSVTITGAVTLGLTTPTHPGKMTLIVTQDGTGHVYSVGGSIKWAGGTAPTYSTAASKIDIISIVYDGTNFYGMAGIAFS